MIKLMAFFFGVSAVLLILTLLWQGAQPGITTTTTAALAAATTDAVGVNSTAGFKSSGGIIVIGNEMMNYGGVGVAGACPAPIPGTSPCFTTLTRSIGSIDPQSHSLGVRVFDEESGRENLARQHDQTIFTTANEQGSQFGLNPFTWKDAVESKMANFIPTFLTGNWSWVLRIFIFFQGLFLLALALLMISIVRGVRLF